MNCIVIQRASRNVLLAWFHKSVKSFKMAAVWGCLRERFGGVKTLEYFFNNDEKGD